MPVKRHREELSTLSSDMTTCDTFSSKTILGVMPEENVFSVVSQKKRACMIAHASPSISNQVTDFSTIERCLISRLN